MILKKKFLSIKCSVGNTYISYLYKDGLKALNASQVTSVKGTYYTKSSLNNDYEILTLNGSLESNKGSTPLFFTKDKDKSIFRFDESKSQLAHRDHSQKNVPSRFYRSSNLRIRGFHNR